MNQTLATADYIDRKKDQIAQTRSALKSKVHSLEEKVDDKVEQLQGSLEKVQKTVEKAQDGLNVAKHVRQNPWLSLGLSVAGGFLVSAYGGRQILKTAAKAGFVSLFQDLAREELKAVKGFAMDAALGLAKNVAQDRLPESLGPRVNGLLERVNHRLHP